MPLCAPLLLTTLLAGAPGPGWLVLPVEGDDVSAAQQRAIDDAIRAGLARAGTSARTSAESRALIADAAAGGLVCTTGDVVCAAQLGAIADVPAVMIVHLDAAHARLQLRAIDVGARRVSLEAWEPVGSDPALAALAAATRLSNPAALLELVVTPAGARIVVDTTDVGEAPMSAPLAVAAGPHRLRITAPGRAADERVVVTAVGAAPRVEVTLVETPSSPATDAPPSRVLPSGVPSPALASSSSSGSFPVVAGALAIGGGLTFAVGATLTTIEEIALSQPARGAPDADAINSARGLGQAGLAVAGVGLLVAAAGLGMWLVPAEGP